MSWADEDSDSTALFEVVINHEEQYSIWAQGWNLPAGWRAAGHSGTKAECLAHIDEVWTDMRPLSLRQHGEVVRDAVGDASIGPG